MKPESALVQVCEADLDASRRDDPEGGLVFDFLEDTKDEDGKPIPALTDTRTV